MHGLLTTLLLMQLHCTVSDWLGGLSEVVKKQVRVGRTTSAGHIPIQMSKVSCIS